MIKFARRSAKKFINHFIRKSKWFDDQFVSYEGKKSILDIMYGDNPRRNCKLLAFGSSSGYWGLDFKSVGFDAMNFTQSPQLMINDYRLLKLTHGFLMSGGTVVFVVCPFSSISNPETVRDTFRFLRFYYRPQLSLRRDLLDAAGKLYSDPMKLGGDAVRAGLKCLLRREAISSPIRAGDVDANPMQGDALLRDAQERVNAWKRQFGIADLDYPLIEEHEFGREYKISLMNRMVNFCQTRGYRPVIVVPPVTQALLSLFSDEMREIYVNSYLRNFQSKITVLSYLDCKDFYDDDLYFNSFYLNRRGRKLFTSRLLKDLGYSYGD